MYAVVDDRNQQYRVQAGDRIQIHLRSDAEAGADLHAAMLAGGRAPADRLQHVERNQHGYPMSCGMLLISDSE